MEQKIIGKSYLSQELPIHYVVDTLRVNKLTVKSVVDNLNNILDECAKLKIEADKKPLRGCGLLVNLSKIRIENAKKLLPQKQQELIKQRNLVVNGSNYTEDMAIAIEQFDNFVAKEYGLYFS